MVQRNSLSSFYSNFPVLNRFDEISCRFEPYSSYTSRTRDIAFWLPANFVENDFYDFVRDKLPSDSVEDIKLIDDFTKEGRISHCYRLTYR